ncbi:hypothetical protein RBB50_003689 [Rhinocladiella similis]
MGICFSWALLTSDLLLHHYRSVRLGNAANTLISNLPTTRVSTPMAAQAGRCCPIYSLATLARVSITSSPTPPAWLEWPFLHSTRPIK